MSFFRSTSDQEREAGFTLIEILIVIVVIGILSGIAFFGVRGIRESSVAKACNANAVQVLKAFEAYKIDKGIYPNDRQIGEDFTNDDVQVMIYAGYLRTNYLTKSPDYKLVASVTSAGTQVIGRYTSDNDKPCQAP